MTVGGGAVAILGGGMAGLSAAWRLSEPGWQDRFDSITVYQRGWRLGGKAASSRGCGGRIEEHGLHIWLGSYENAFKMLRECYAELDRATTDPGSPIASWREALVPADNPGLTERFGGEWTTWLGTHPHDDGVPGAPDDEEGRALTAATFVERALRLLAAFTASLAGDDTPAAGLSFTASAQPPPATSSAAPDALRRALLAGVLAIGDSDGAKGNPTLLIEAVLDAARESIEYESRPADRRGWILASLLAATIRGIIADDLITDPRGFRAINDVDFGAWVLSHGGHPDILASPLIRGLYDLVFGYADGDPQRPAVAAGTMAFLVGQVLFGYRGALFWKMTAGMGDVVIAPLYQALRRRGVRFEFFHRVVALQPDPRGHNIDAITLARQVDLADGRDTYEPLTTVKGLPVFPATPLTDQIVAGSAVGDLESHFADTPDVEQRVLRRGEQFDHVVLAVSIGMLPVIAPALISDRPEWAEMTAHVKTVATQALQLWLRPAEPALGWHASGATISAYLRPFETWASMPQTLWAEHWPDGDTPQTVAYFCGSLKAEWPTAEPHDSYLSRLREAVVADATHHVEANLELFFPNAYRDGDFRWELLCGSDARTGRAAIETQHLSVNVDPSDRYVQSVPGSDRYRLRPDESGYDNLVLAGDWTDTGINAGCIEAAVVSGLQAANALLGRGRYHRIRGFYMP